MTGLYRVPTNRDKNLRARLRTNPHLRLVFALNNVAYGHAFSRFLDFSLQKIHSGTDIPIDQSLVKNRGAQRRLRCGHHPSSWRTTLALSFALLLHPDASNAQFSIWWTACTAGNGLYSCDFKDETGTEIFSASIRLAVDPGSYFFPSSRFQIRIVLFRRSILPVCAGERKRG